MTAEDAYDYCRPRKTRAHLLECVGQYDDIHGCYATCALSTVKQ